MASAGVWGFTTLAVVQDSEGKSPGGGNLNWFRSRRSSLAVGGGLLLPLAIAGLMVPFRASFAEAAAALVLIAVVALVATVGTRPAGYVASVFAAIWFDFFLTQPYERMAITQRPDIEITLSLLVVGVFITELAASNRHHHLVAAQESDFVRLIHDVSELASRTRRWTPSWSG